MSMNRHFILNYVDTPLRLLLWTVPEILMLIGPFFLGLILEQLTLGFVTSILYFYGYKKYQQKFGKGQFHAVKYWYFPTDGRFKTLPASYLREYIG